MRNRIQVFEHQKLYYSEAGPFRDVHWKALVRYAEQTGEVYYSVLGKGIKFSSYVGVIQAGNLTIEVLPKTDVPGTIAANDTSDGKDPDKNLWHQVLLDMLKECRLLQAEQSNKAFLKFRSYSLLEIYLELFLSETEQLFHQGLLKKYRKEEGNLLSLKGQLQFAQNTTKNIVHKERFFTRHTVYSQQNIFNQLLYKTLKLIPRVTNSPFIIDKANRLLFSFPELSDIKVEEGTFGRLVYDRKTERYKDALAISRMILLNYHPDITGGGENVVAILFDMNRLWEEFVYRRLKKEEEHYYIEVTAQQSAKFWKPETGYTKTVRPDIVINYILDEGAKELKKTVVLDTKWKKLQNLTPSDDDLKQMFVYNLFWNCNKSVLLYPATEPASGNGDYYHYQLPNEFINKCAVETVSVLDEQKSSINKVFGRKVLDTVLGQKVLEQLSKD